MEVGNDCSSSGVCPETCLVWCVYWWSGGDDNDNAFTWHKPGLIYCYFWGQGWQPEQPKQAGGVEQQEILWNFVVTKPSCAPGKEEPLEAALSTLSLSQQWALAAMATSILGCANRSTAKRLREGVILINTRNTRNKLINWMSSAGVTEMFSGWYTCLRRSWGSWACTEWK